MPLDRRSLLLATTGLAGAASLSAQTPSGRAGSGRFRLAAGLGMVAGAQDLTAKFRMLRDAGFDGVELDAPSELTAEAVRDARRATGIEVSGIVDSVHWHKPLSHADASVRDQARAALERAIADCAAFGGDSVLLVPAVVDANTAYDVAWERSAAEIRKVLPVAEAAKVRIAIENVWNQFLLSPLEAARYVDQFDSPWIGWHFDVGNVVNYGWPEQWIRILGPRILKLHVKEFSRKARDERGLWKGFEAEIGEGDNRWAEVVRALEEIGYRGWATAEVAGGDAARLADVAARMRRVLGA